MRAVIPVNYMSVKCWIFRNFRTVICFLSQKQAAWFAHCCFVLCWFFYYKSRLHYSVCPFLHSNLWDHIYALLSVPGSSGSCCDLRWRSRSQEPLQCCCGTHTGPQQGQRHRPGRQYVLHCQHYVLLCLLISILIYRRYHFVLTIQESNFDFYSDFDLLSKRNWHHMSECWLIKWRVWPGIS